MLLGIRFLIIVAVVLLMEVVCLKVLYVKMDKAPQEFVLVSSILRI